MNRSIPTRLLAGTIAALALVAAGCGDDDDATEPTGDTAAPAETPAPDTVAATTPAATAPAATTPAATTAATEPPETEPPAGFEGELIGTFAIEAADCAGGAATAGSYFKMLQPGGTVDAGPFIENADSPCGDKTFTALSPGTDGGLNTGVSQPPPEPAFDAAGNATATAIFEPVAFFAVRFGVATDPAEAVPTITSTGGALAGDLSAFTAYYGTAVLNQGAPKPDGSGEGPTGTIDAATGAFVLEWTSLIVGGPFDSFTGVWHLEGTFTPAS